MTSPDTPTTPSITVLPELLAYIDPLTADEEEALERSLLREGCRDALVLWGDILVDGHNRYRLCQKHGLPFRTVQNTQFQSMEDVHLWMIDQHLGRRSLSEFQRGVLALRKREIIAARRSTAAAAVQSARAEAAAQQADATPPWEASAEDASSPLVAQALARVPQVPDEALDSRQALARVARLTPTQVKMIETIHQNAAPEVVAAVKSGELSLNAAAIVASLPLPEQQSAAAAGAQELKQVARRVRDAKKKPASDKRNASEGSASADAHTSAAPAEAAAAPANAAALQARIDELEAENARLRQQVQALQDLLAEQG